MSEDNPTIEWREIPGFPGYRASSNGEIETLWTKSKRIVITLLGRRYPTILSTKWRSVNLFIHKTTGRLAFTIPPDASPNRKQLQVFVHKLVCIAFHGEPIGNQQVCHFPDPDVTNNKSSNLMWGSSKVNQSHRVIHGTDSRGERCPTARLTRVDIIEIRRLASTGVSQRIIGEKFNILRSSVSNIVTRKSWSWLD